MMAKILAVATHATDDPTKASLAFITAAGAVDAGEEATIALIGDGVYLANGAVAKAVHGVGFQPLPELIEKVVQAGVPVFV
jgi:predicted peroxiredoxin